MKIHCDECGGGCITDYTQNCCFTWLNTVVHQLYLHKARFVFQRIHSTGTYMGRASLIGLGYKTLGKRLPEEERD